MSSSFLGIFCVFLAGSGVVHSLTFGDNISPHKLFQVHNHWDHPVWKDQYAKAYMRFYQRKHIDPNLFKVLPKYPRYHTAEFPIYKSQDVRIMSSFLKSDTHEKNSESSESMKLFIRRVPSSNSASNSISSTSIGATNPVFSNNILYDDSDTKISIKDETHLGAAENIASSEPESILNQTDSDSESNSKTEEGPQEKNTEPTPDSNTDSDSESNSKIEEDPQERNTEQTPDSNTDSDSESNSKIEENTQERNTEPTTDSNTDSSSVQNTVSPTNDPSYSISDLPNLSTNEATEESILSTSFEPLTEENTQATDLSTVYSTLIDSSTESTPHQSINPVTDETSTIMTSQDETTKLTKMTKPPTSETVSQSSKSAILSTRGSSVYMTSSSNNDRPDSYSTSSAEDELHESRDILVVTEHETVIEISSIRRAKVVVASVFLTVALVATAVLTVYIVKTKRREVQYDQITLLP